MSINCLARLTLLGTLAALPLAASAQVYKWIDDNGRTIVSDTPPPTGLKAEQLRKPIGTPAESTGEPPGEKQAGAASTANEKDKAPVPDQFSCAQARVMLQELESGRPLIVNSAQGQPVEMSKEARTGEIARLKDLLKGCK